MPPLPKEIVFEEQPKCKACRDTGINSRGHPCVCQMRTLYGRNELCDIVNQVLSDPNAFINGRPSKKSGLKKRKR